MLLALLNTVKWVLFDQRTLIARGFDKASSFSITLLLPIYVAKKVNRASFGLRRVVFFWRPEHFAAIHKTSSQVIDTGAAYSFLKPYFGDESVFVSSGEGHVAAKQAVYRTIKSNMSIENDDFIFFNFSMSENFRSGVYPVLGPIQRISAAFVLRTIFGEQGTAEAERTITTAIAAAGNASGTFLILPNVLRWTRRFGVGLQIRRQRMYLRRFIIKQLDGMDIAANWIGEDPAKARTEIIDNLMTLLIAGFETTATTIAWLLYELAMNSELQADIRSEVERRLTSEPFEYLQDDTSLLACAVQETLRLHPSIPFIVREVREAFDVGDVRLEPGNYLVLSIDELHKRGFDGGVRFDPLRFADKRAVAKIATFGGGAKICPGRAIAVQQTRIVAALILAKYFLKPTAETCATIIRNRVSATPKDGMILEFSRIR